MKNHFNIPDTLTTFGVLAGTALSYKILSELGITTFYADTIPNEILYGNSNKAGGMIMMATVSLLPVMAASALTIKATVRSFKELANFARNAINSEFGNFFKNLNDGIIRFTDGMSDEDYVALSVHKDGSITKEPKTKHGIYQNVKVVNNVVENTLSNYDNGKLSDTSERIAMLRQKIDLLNKTREETYISASRTNDLSNENLLVR